MTTPNSTQIPLKEIAKLIFYCILIGVWLIWQDIVEDTKNLLK